MSDYEAMRIHVYHDTQVEQQVSRRFEQYGASTRGGASSGSDTGSSNMMGGDPMVHRPGGDGRYFGRLADGSKVRLTVQPTGGIPHMEETRKKVAAC